MHPGRGDGSIWIRRIEAIGVGVVRVAIEVAPIARLKPNRISFTGLQVQRVEWAVFPDVGLICTAVAADSLADV